MVGELARTWLPATASDRLADGSAGGVSGFPARLGLSGRAVAHLLLASRLRAPVAPRRPDRRSHALGDPGTPGARIREHRGRVAGRRPLRRAGGAGALRRAGQLAGARRRADGGDRGAVGGHGGGLVAGGRRAASPRSRRRWRCRPASRRWSRVCCGSASWPTSSVSRCSRASSSAWRSRSSSASCRSCSGSAGAAATSSSRPGELVTHLGDTQGLTLLVGTLSLALIVGLRRRRSGRSRARWWRSRAAIAAVKAFGLDVPTIGSIASGLPSLGLPDIGLGGRRRRWPPAASA